MKERHTLNPDQSVTLIEAVGVYVEGLKSKDGQSQTQQELLKFVRWCGADRAMSELRPPEVGDYAEHAVGSGVGTQTQERLDGVKKFLSFAKKKGFTEQNLSPHMRATRGRSRSRRGKEGDAPKVTKLTRGGHAKLVTEREELKARRGPLAVEIRRAAADKDVRENVPLEAARERLGHVETRIREVEEVLKGAVIIGPSGKADQVVRLGAKIVVKDLGTGRQTRYTLVDATEASPLDGKISDVSPVGKALLRRSVGQDVEVETPRGKLRYKIVKVSA